MKTFLLEGLMIGLRAAFGGVPDAVFRPIAEAIITVSLEVADEDQREAQINALWAKASALHLRGAA
jgi:hypothetical protein